MSITIFLFRYFLSSHLPLEISSFATISCTAAPAIVYQGGAGSPPSPRALPYWSGSYLIITDAKNWSKLIITDEAKTSPIWTTWSRNCEWLTIHNEVTDFPLIKMITINKDKDKDYYGKDKDDKDENKVEVKRAHRLPNATRLATRSPRPPTSHVAISRFWKYKDLWQICIRK